MLNNYFFRSACGILITALLLMNNPVCSQTQNNLPKTWTLEQCLDYAVTNNIQVLRSELNAQQSKAALLQSRGNLYPSLNAGANHNYNFGRSIDPFTNQFIEEQIRSNNFSVNASLPLFNGFQNRTSVRISKIEHDANQADTEAARNDAMLSITASYLQVLLDKELLETSRLQFASTSEQVARTEKLVQAGALALANLLELRGQLASDELALVNAENKLNLSLLNLQQFLQLPVNDAFDIVTPPLPEISSLSEIESINTSELYNTALNKQPVIQSADMRVKSSLLNVQAAKGAYYPRLTLNGNIFTGYSSARQRVMVSGGGTPGFVTIQDIEGNPLQIPRSLFEAGPTRTTERYPFMDQLRDNVSQAVGLTLSIPILNAFQVRSNVSIAVVNAKRAQLNAQESRNQLRQTIEQAYADAKAAFRRYIATQNQLLALREAFRATEQRYNVGAINAQDFNIARNNLYSAESNFLQAKYELIFKVKILDFYQGKPLTF
jgi:outer membrane protein